jgi:hypothetical protein
MFLGAFYLAVWPLVRLGGAGVPAGMLGDDLRRLRPYVLAVVVGWAAGLCSLSCPYTIPTLAVLATSAVYVRLAEGRLGVPVARLDGRLVQRLVLLSAAFVVAAQAGVRLLVRYG